MLNTAFLACIVLCLQNLSFALSNSRDVPKGQTDSNGRLEDLVATLSDRVDQLEAREKTYVAKIESLMADRDVKSSTAGDSNRTKRQYDIVNVAFYAHVGNHLHNLGLHQAVEFDKVYTNIGSAYNPQTGSFIAPQAGTYVFTVTMKCVSGHDNLYNMALNGNSIGELYIHGSVSYASSASRTAVLQLQRGDSVSVRNGYSGEGVYGQGHSSFAGFLLTNSIESEIGGGSLVG